MTVERDSDAQAPERRARIESWRGWCLLLSATMALPLAVIAISDHHSVNTRDASTLLATPAVGDTHESPAAGKPEHERSSPAGPVTLTSPGMPAAAR